MYNSRNGSVGPCLTSPHDGAPENTAKYSKQQKQEKKTKNTTKYKEPHSHPGVLRQQSGWNVVGRNGALHTKNVADFFLHSAPFFSFLQRFHLHKGSD